MKNKSLFPTYEKSIAEDNRKKDEITVNGGGSKTGSISSGLNYSGGGGGSNNSLDGGGGSSSNSMKPKALKKFNVDEALQQQRRAVSSGKSESIRNCSKFNNSYFILMLLMFLLSIQQLFLL